MSLKILVLLTATLTYTAPDGWQPVEPGSTMRHAQWELPGEAGAAEVVLFYFGPGGGGGVQANLARWYGQFEQPDGSSTKDNATVEERVVNGLNVTIADMSGTYVAPVRPGSPERNHRPNHRMIAAIVAGESGPWFLRALGPQATLAEWRESIDAFVDSMRLE